MTRSGSRRHVNWLLQVNNQTPRNARKKTGFDVAFFPRATEGAGVSVGSVMVCRVMNSAQILKRTYSLWAFLRCDLVKNILQRPALAADPIDRHLTFQEQLCPAPIEFWGIFDADVQETVGSLKIESQ